MRPPPTGELQALLRRVEEQRDAPVLLWQGTLAADGLPVLHRCLQAVPRAARLDLVLSTYGGSVIAARQIALLLREFTDRLTILVPQRARSAGTLLCLGADELMLSPFAELSPLDANMGATEAQPPGTPGVVSAEDIRAFPRLARDWFGVTGPDDGLQLLAMLSQRIFPASLSAFYRHDKLIREVAGELLEFQLPDPADQSVRARIVEQLVAGYHAHDYVLTRRDARRLGLRLAEPSPAEEALLAELAGQLAHSRFGGAGMFAEDEPAGEDAAVTGIIASVDLVGCHLIRQHTGPDGSRTLAGEPGWRIEG